MWGEIRAALDIFCLRVRVCEKRMRRGGHAEANRNGIKKNNNLGEKGCCRCQGNRCQGGAAF